MLQRRKSIFDYVRDVLPVFALVGVGAASVLLAMEVLVTAAPVLVHPSSPSPTATPFVPPGSPSARPIDLPQPTEGPFPTASLPDTNPVLGSGSISAHDPNGVWNVYLVFPEFKVGTTPWAAEMNAAVASAEQTQADIFEQGPAALRQAVGKVNNLTGSFTTEMLTPTLASVILQWVDDTVPGHPAVTLQTLNFDLSTGQPLAFTDIFLDTGTALTVVSSRSADLLYYSLGAAWNQDSVRQGTLPIAANFQNWSVTAAGLKITFNQHQVVNTTALPSIVIPWTDLRAVLRTTGPVARLAGM